MIDRDLHRRDALVLAHQAHRHRRLRRTAAAHAPAIPPDIPADQIEVFRYFVEGRTIKEIAALRVESKSRTERMLRELLKKLRCANLFQAILQAERWGLLDNVVIGEQEKRLGA